MKKNVQHLRAVTMGMVPLDLLRATEQDRVRKKAQRVRDLERRAQRSEKRRRDD